MVKANSRKRTVFINFMKRYCHNKLAIAGLVSIVLIGLLVAFLPRSCNMPKTKSTRSPSAQLPAAAISWGRMMLDGMF
ncbi:hypothetical protein JI735_30655 [Paenibacillus sonchi]|uniref:Oligopeptide transport permease C-like N-terminal domain-containing protein n=1 Tax=Paenibacillus sonchi TaxID=373687 RepID=A0A974PBH6_9BACL|nr:hypothetical protein [Paenibacillus sonchi]QQZ60766.1 hypothetical protein JI735_30655 [Paenibacillus sonchi]